MSHTHRFDRTRAATRGRRARPTEAAYFVALVVLVELLLLSGCSQGGGIASLFDGGVRKDLEQADALLADQRHDEAAELYEQITQRKPGHPEANGRLARICFQRGDYDRAMRCYREALKTKPDSFPYALGLAQSLSRLAMTAPQRDKVMDAAARAYRYAQSLDPKNFTAVTQLAMCYREQGDFTRAIETLQEAAKLYPNAAVIQTQLGEIYHSQNQIEPALACFQRALELDAKNVEAHNGCGMVNVALSQSGGIRATITRERAVAHFKRSLQLYDRQPQIRTMLNQLEPYQWRAVTVSDEAGE
jgi:tetratricopeptide (TPR) repeat protein